MLSGSKLMFLRIRHNRSQQYIADCIGVTQEYISMIENSKKPMTENIYDKYIDAIYGKIVPPKKRANTRISDGDEIKNESTAVVSSESDVPVTENVIVEQSIESIKIEPKKTVKRTNKAKG